MRIKHPLTGSIVALITPMFEDGSVDFDEAIKSLVEIKVGDPIVHENYGVGRYLGLKTQTFDNAFQSGNS